MAIGANPQPSINTKGLSDNPLIVLVGAVRFELTTLCSQSRSHGLWKSVEIE